MLITILVAYLAQMRPFFRLKKKSSKLDWSNCMLMEESRVRKEVPCYQLQTLLFPCCDRVSVCDFCVFCANLLGMTFIRSLSNRPDLQTFDTGEKSANTVSRYPLCNIVFCTKQRWLIGLVCLRRCTFVCHSQDRFYCHKCRNRSTLNASLWLSQFKSDY